MNMQFKGVLAEDLYFFSREKMTALANELRPKFAEAVPFPHVVIDDFFPTAIAERIGKSFPAIDDIDWRFEGPGDSKHTGNKRVEKVSTNDEEKFPDYIRFLMMQFQSGIFCSFLDQLTGYKYLAPDPSHHGCGLHSTGNGGRLMLHIDASRHPNKDLNQIINCIYYCSPNWKPDYGGNLELWNEDATKCVASVEPKFNRMIIFFTAGKSWHGQPHPVVCPPEMRRNSLALYYYTTDTGVTNFDYSNFVRWKGVTEHDKKSIVHHVKAGIRTLLPVKAVNALARGVRKAGLNRK